MEIIISKIYLVFDDNLLEIEVLRIKILIFSINYIGGSVQGLGQSLVEEEELVIKCWVHYFIIYLLYIVARSSVSFLFGNHFGVGKVKHILI